MVLEKEQDGSGDSSVTEKEDTENELTIDLYPGMRNGV